VPASGTYNSGIYPLAPPPWNQLGTGRRELTVEEMERMRKTLDAEKMERRRKILDAEKKEKGEEPKSDTQ
jgi:hypothetical protein